MISSTVPRPMYKVPPPFVQPWFPVRRRAKHRVANLSLALHEPQVIPESDAAALRTPAVGRPLPAPAWCDNHRVFVRQALLAVEHDAAPASRRELRAITVACVPEKRVLERIGGDSEETRGHHNGEDGQGQRAAGDRPNDQPRQPAAHELPVREGEGFVELLESLVEFLAGDRQRWADHDDVPVRHQVEPALESRFPHLCHRSERLA